jgi:hypothetical protein
MHPLFGYTKGGVLTPLIQVIVSGSCMLPMLDILKSFEVHLLTAAMSIKHFIEASVVKDIRN